MSAAKPSLLIVITGDPGCVDPGCHGNQVACTPHLDRLHAESVRRTDCRSVAMCPPAEGL